MSKFNLDKEFDGLMSLIMKLGSPECCNSMSKTMQVQQSVRLRIKKLYDDGYNEGHHVGYHEGAESFRGNKDE